MICRRLVERDGRCPPGRGHGSILTHHDASITVVRHRWHLPDGLTRETGFATVG